MNITPQDALKALDEVAKAQNANRETHLYLSACVMVLEQILPQCDQPTEEPAK